MITATNIFVLANILYAASYLVRDILWLRALAVTAAASSIPYFYLQSTPQFWPIFWQCAFIAINLVHAVALVRERMPVDMTESEKRLHLLAFRTLRPRELLRLSRTAQWRTARPGEVLLSRGETSNRVILVFHGVLKVTDGDRVRAHLRDGQFAGEMSLVSGKPHSADVVADEETRYLVWNRSQLEKLWRRYPQIQDVFESIIGLDMADKLGGGQAGDAAPA